MSTGLGSPSGTLAERLDLLRRFVNDQKTALRKYKVELGLCIETGCREETYKSVRCEKHKLKAAKVVRECYAKKR